MYIIQILTIAYVCYTDGGGGPVFETAVNEYYHTHDPMSYIGITHNATVAGHSIHVPPAMFDLPPPPPQHCAQVCRNCRA